MHLNLWVNNQATSSKLEKSSSILMKYDQNSRLFGDLQYDALLKEHINNRTNAKKSNNERRL